MRVFRGCWRLWALALGESWGQGKGGMSDMCWVTFSQAPSLSGASLLSFVNLRSPGSVLQVSHQTHGCAGPLTLSLSSFAPTYSSTFKASPPSTENQNQEENGLLRPLVSVQMNCGWDHGIVLMANVLMLVTVRSQCRRISLFLRSTHLNTWPLRERISSTYFRMI